MTLSDLRRDDWSRFSLKQRLQRYGVLALTLLALGWAVSSIEVIWAWVWDAPEQMGDLFGRMIPPDPSNLSAILRVLWETVNIATIATAFAVILSLPVAWLAAQNTTPNRATLWVGRFILVSSRSINRCLRSKYSLKKVGGRVGAVSQAKDSSRFMDD